jgi:hypothetical protein
MEIPGRGECLGRSRPWPRWRGPLGTAASRLVVGGILIAWTAGTGAIWTLPHPWVLTVVAALDGVAGSGPVIRGLGGVPRQRVGLTPRLTHAPAEQAGRSPSRRLSNLYLGEYLKGGAN